MASVGEFSNCLNLTVADVHYSGIFHLRFRNEHIKINNKIRNYNRKQFQARSLHGKVSYQNQLGLTPAAGSRSGPFSVESDPSSVAERGSILE